MLAIAALTCTALACLWPTDASDLQDPAVLVSPQAPVTTGLALSADTYLRQGEPNQNFGTELILRVRPTGKNRALLQVDPAALAAVVGGAPVTAARLELTITHNADNWGPMGREIALHRLTVPWTELGATWNCGVDTVPRNPQAECAPGTAWEMGTAGPNPWVGTPTATATITSGLTGVVRFDVKADVAAWLGGALNAGWILKRVDEGPSGAVEFGARESPSPPQLVVAHAPADTSRPGLPDALGLPPDSTALTVQSPEDTGTVYHRNIVGVVFDDSTSGATIRGILARHGATIVGGGVTTYLLRVADPGPSLSGLDSVRTAIATEVGVAYVLRVPLRASFDPRGRYPIDGPSSKRSNWFDAAPGPAVRSRLAVRAPLAWGCETGTYGPGRVRVGVVDLVFDSTHFDLPAYHLSEPSTELQEIRLLQDPVARSHGLGVAGVVGAVGDNEQGIAGIMWNLELFMLAHGRGTAVQQFPVNRWEAMLREAGSNGVRIIVSSTGFELSSDTTAVRKIREALAAFLAGGSDRLFIMPVRDKNSGLNLDVATVRTDTSRRVFATDRAVAQLYSTFPDQIIIVAGTDLGGGRWSESDFWMGATSIVAPAVQVMTLARVADFPETGTRVASGTSYAAPFVAGVAAQLVGMDSSLSAAQVKDYIIRGARFRINADGLLETNPAVSGAPEPAYQLDAYGALTLLARERPHTPICGFPVFARDDAVFQVRSPGDTQTIPVPVPAGTYLANVSVAQGGRPLAVSRLSGGDAVVQFTPTGQAVGSPLPLTRRQFLERDTLDWSLFDGNSDSWLILRRGNGTTDSLNAAALTFPTPTGTRFTAEVEGSPAGDWVAVRTLDAAGATVTHRWDLLDFVQRVPQPVATIVRSLPLPLDCPDCDGIFVPERSAGWTHDGRLAVFAFPRADRVSGSLVGLRTRVQRIPVVNGVPSLPGPTDVVEQVIAKRPRFTADDAVLIWNELDLASTCYRATRPASTPTQLLGRDVADIGECDLGDAGPTIFNTPPPAVTAGGTAGYPAVRRAHPARR